LRNFYDKTWDRTNMLTDVLVRYLMYWFNVYLWKEPTAVLVYKL